MLLMVAIYPHSLQIQLWDSRILFHGQGYWGILILKVKVTYLEPQNAGKNLYWAYVNPLYVQQWEGWSEVRRISSNYCWRHREGVFPRVQKNSHQSSYTILGKDDGWMWNSNLSSLSAMCSCKVLKMVMLMMRLEMQLPWEITSV